MDGGVADSARRRVQHNARARTTSGPVFRTHSHNLRTRAPYRCSALIRAQHHAMDEQRWCFHGRQKRADDEMS